MQEKIIILGSNGVIGNGIFLALKNKFKILKINSSAYDINNNRYKLNYFKKSDYFIHAAGVTEEEINKFGYKRSFLRANLETKKLLKYLIKQSCKNFIYISSSRIYSDVTTHQSEGKTKIDLDEHYKVCHFTTENLIKNLANRYNLNYLILRPGATYGFSFNKKKLNRVKLIPYSFPISLYKNQQITLKTSGIQKRNFCSNIDIGNKVKKWILKKNKHSIISNVLGDKICSVKTFANICIKIYFKVFKKKGIIVYNKKFKKTLEKKLIVTQVLKSKNTQKVENFLSDLFVMMKKNKIKKNTYKL